MDNFHLSICLISPVETTDQVFLVASGALYFAMFACYTIYCIMSQKTTQDWTYEAIIPNGTYILGYSLMKGWPLDILWREKAESWIFPKSPDTYLKNQRITHVLKKEDAFFLQLAAAVVHFNYLGHVPTSLLWNHRNIISVRTPHTMTIYYNLWIKSIAYPSRWTNHLSFDPFHEACFKFLARSRFELWTLGSEDKCATNSGMLPSKI